MTAHPTSHTRRRHLGPLDIERQLVVVAYARFVGGVLVAASAVRNFVGFSWSGVLSMAGVPKGAHDARGRNRRMRDERGSISIWMATSSFIMIVVVGMAVDLGGQVHTQQQARNVAAQAARTGAQEVQASTAVRGEVPQASISDAKAAAYSYLAQAGVEGAVSVRGGDTIVVQVSDTYDCAFLSIINLDSMRVTGEASARMIRTEGGIEQ